MKNTYKTSVVSVLMVLFVSLILFLNSCQGSKNTTQESSNPSTVIFSFVYMGDNQIGDAGWLATHDTNPSSANVPQLRQNIIDTNNLSPKPAFVMMGGDMVLNEAEDIGQTLTGQLNGWDDVFAAIPGSGDINFIPLIGNHESNTYNAALGAEYPLLAFSTIFIEWLSHNGYDIYAGNGPTPVGENSDKLVRDESKLTYSFDYLNNHFIIMNTDTETTQINPATNKSYTGWIPVNWVVNDIETAQANPNISNIILMGHKPISSPKGSSDAIINTSQYPFGTRLLTAIEENPKVRVYLSSHLHSYYYEKLATNNDRWEFISGNAGAPPQSDLNYWKGQPGFGFLLVKIYSDGNIGITSYRRPIPSLPQQPYEDTPVAPVPATPEQEIILYE